MRLAFLFFSLALTNIDVANATPRIEGVASIVDGDTIEIHGQRIRLFGIDAPESRQLCQEDSGKNWRCGQKAALALSDWISRSVISCTQKDIDRYNRIVAICFKGGEDVNAWMVRNGWALNYRQYSTAYLGDEAYAQKNRLNLWSGTFENPWDWRHKR